MEKRIFDNSPVEPVHRASVALYEDLLSIYRTIRESSQAAIDKAFDRASQEIGYLVTTTVPCTFVIGEEGKLEGFELSAGHLQGSIFDRTLHKALEPLIGQQFEVRTGGSYSLRLLWLEALKLRLKTHWLEPAHFRREWLEPAHFRREWQEPAHLPMGTAGPRPRSHPVGVLEPVHWFDPGFAIAGEEKVLISVLDEVYPELSLAQRIIDARTHQVERWPGTREPAHYRPALAIGHQLQQWPGIREPAHYHPVGGYDLPVAQWPGTREPAHYRPTPGLSYQLAQWPGIREPAHYQPVGGYDLPVAQWPGTREPAHYRPTPGLSYQLQQWPGIREPAHYQPVGGYGYPVAQWPGTREPAHYRPPAGFDQQQAVGVLQELATLLRKHGL
jgi:hypothetical protein